MRATPRRASLALAGLAGLAAAGCRPRPAVPSDAAGTRAADDAAPGAPATAGRSVLYSETPGSFVELVANAKGGVVAIRGSTPIKGGPAAMFPGATQAAGDVALGSGFLIDHQGTFVLTTDHIAAASPELTVVLRDGTTAPAKVVGRDGRLDVALLAVELRRPHVLALGDSGDLRVGEWLVVLGNPFGDEVSASAGIVSATGGSSGSLVAGTGSTFRTFIQTDAHVHRGNAGGPVLNSAGQVVGIAVATGDRLGEVGFVIPIDRIKEVLDPLKDYGSVARSWLGVQVLPVTADLATRAGLGAPRGALVTDVRAGSPAARAGLVAGDVILRWAGKDVDSRSLVWAVAGTPVGKAVQAVVWRAGAEHAVAVTTEPMPE
jgi:serine protease Do